MRQGRGGARSFWQRDVMQSASERIGQWLVRLKNGGGTKQKHRDRSPPTYVFLSLEARRPHIACVQYSLFAASLGTPDRTIRDCSGNLCAARCARRGTGKLVGTRPLL
jgi:hypothetical protein